VEEAGILQEYVKPFEIAVVDRALTIDYVLARMKEVLQSLEVLFRNGFYYVGLSSGQIGISSFEVREEFANYVHQVQHSADSQAMKNQIINNMQMAIKRKMRGENANEAIDSGNKTFISRGKVRFIHRIGSKCRPESFKHLNVYLERYTEVKDHLGSNTQKIKTDYDFCVKMDLFEYVLALEKFFILSGNSGFSFKKLLVLIEAYLLENNVGDIASAKYVKELSNEPVNSFGSASAMVSEDSENEYLHEEVTEEAKQELIDQLSAAIMVKLTEENVKSDERVVKFFIRYRYYRRELLEFLFIMHHIKQKYARRFIIMMIEDLMRFFRGETLIYDENLAQFKGVSNEFIYLRFLKFSEGEDSMEIHNSKIDISDLMRNSIKNQSVNESEMNTSEVNYNKDITKKNLFLDENSTSESNTQKKKMSSSVVIKPNVMMRSANVHKSLDLGRNQMPNIFTVDKSNENDSQLQDEESMSNSSNQMNQSKKINGSNPSHLTEQRDSPSNRSIDEDGKTQMTELQSNKTHQKSIEYARSNHNNSPKITSNDNSQLSNDSKKVLDNTLEQKSSKTVRSNETHSPLSNSHKISRKTEDQSELYKQQYMNKNSESSVEKSMKSHVSNNQSHENSNLSLQKSPVLNTSAKSVHKDSQKDISEHSSKKASPVVSQSHKTERQSTSQKQVLNDKSEISNNSQKSIKDQESEKSSRVNSPRKINKKYVSKSVDSEMDYQESFKESKHRQFSAVKQAKLNSSEKALAQSLMNNKETYEQFERKQKNDGDQKSELEKKKQEIINEMRESFNKIRMKNKKEVQSDSKSPGIDIDDDSSKNVQKTALTSPKIDMNKKAAEVSLENNSQNKSNLSESKEFQTPKSNQSQINKSHSSQKQVPIVNEKSEIKSKKSSMKNTSEKSDTSPTKAEKKQSIHVSQKSGKGAKEVKDSTTMKKRKEKASKKIYIKKKKKNHQIYKKIITNFNPKEARDEENFDYIEEKYTEYDEEAGKEIEIEKITAVPKHLI
jgi:hypothetical protein